jgi:hypothetical protein
MAALVAEKSVREPLKKVVGSVMTRLIAHRLVLRLVRMCLVRIVPSIRESSGSKHVA